VANELVWAEEWIYSKLASYLTSAGLTWKRAGSSTAEPRLFSDWAPDEAPYPFVIMQVQSPGEDVLTATADHVWSQPLFLVKVVGQTASYGSLKATYAGIHARLQKASGTTAEGHILSCYRVGPFRLPDPDREHKHLGGFYRIAVQPIGA
jgi:hypothetical protein